MGKWLTDDKGFFLSPSRQKSADGQAARRRKKHRTNKDKFYGRKLHRFCPICNTELTARNVIHEEFYSENKNKRYTRALFVCKECRRIWASKETNKVWKEKRPKTQRKILNKQFKKEINGI